MLSSLRQSTLFFALCNDEIMCVVCTSIVGGKAAILYVVGPTALLDKRCSLYSPVVFIMSSNTDLKILDVVDGNPRKTTCQRRRSSTLHLIFVMRLWEKSTERYPWDYWSLAQEYTITQMQPANNHAIIGGVRFISALTPWVSDFSRWESPEMAYSLSQQNPQLCIIEMRCPFGETGLAEESTVISSLKLTGKV